MSRNSAEIDTKSAEAVSLGGFAFSPKTKTLQAVDGSVVQLRIQSAEVLAILAENAGQIVPKDVLIEKVWAETFVTDDSLVQCIADIRRALGERGREIVQTFPKKGYLLHADAPLIAEKATKQPLPLPDKPSIAVLAFDNLSGDPQQEYVSDSISEAIITGLSRLSELFVIARQSSFSYKGTAATVQQIAEELGVSYVLEGSVQRSEGRIRVTGQLIDAATGRHLWAQQYDRQWEDIFALQDDITQNIVANIVSFEGPLEEAVRGRIKEKAPADLRAYDYLLLGRERFFLTTKDENAKARELFHRAVEVDPNYSPGYAWLAWTQIVDFSWGWSTDPALVSGLAFDYAQRALELDNASAGAHWVLGAALALAGKQPQRALAEYERALALSPNNADLMAQYGWRLPYLGRPEEAVESIKRAMRLNPVYPNWYGQALMFALYNAKRYREVVAVARTVRVSHLRTHLDLAGSYAQLGQLDDARASVAKALEIDPGFSLRAWREIQNFTRPADLEHYFEGLRNAGLPE